jgi:hypothetical protein
MELKAGFMAFRLKILNFLGSIGLSYYRIHQSKSKSGTALIIIFKEGEKWPTKRAV